MEKKRFLALALQKRIILGMDHHATNFIEGFGYVQKKYTRGLVLGKATVNQLRYSEQCEMCT
ncbi:hypothetical protein TNCV_4354021, partial [Trichonephila clavipes]